ncbi:hypothetical protein AJ79_09313 [Helicocarpus griseus UAMH5409]|uniref:Uncharacterized protein n=1 Tax=Helicocarpus griseus UAMH5409 TaxID=1447875 RepID=A0A2B7WKQ0_9EURO|nr:hypothetical protein AJ79_09313 [Helicocarpus griseus UAMH5409]
MAASGHRINQLSGLALENSPKPRTIIIMEDQIISALEVLSSASAESLGRIFLQNSVIFKNAHGRLMKTIKRKEGSTVMELAETNFERIEVFFQKPEKEVVGNPYWVGVDVRVLDIQRFSRRKTYQDAFRCYLAERSLALEFEAWEKKNYQTSRVDEIVKNPSVAENKTGGHLAEFLTSKRQNDGCEVPPDGLKNGQKYLVIERQNPEHRAIVAILSLHSASRVRNTSFNDLEIIRSMLAADKYKNITRLAKDKSEYLDRAQSLYYYSLSGYSTGYDGEKIELRPFKRRRTDQGNDLQKSPVEGLSTENVWPTPSVH